MTIYRNSMKQANFMVDATAGYSALYTHIKRVFKHNKSSLQKFCSNSNQNFYHVN